MEKQSFEAVEKHLYKRQYQTATGDWSTLYYAIFTCWDSKRRTFKAGETLANARDELGRLRTLDKGRFDFGAEKREQQAAKVKPMLLGEWLDKYLDLNRGRRSWKTRKAEVATLKRLMGNIAVGEVNRVRILEFKTRRMAENVIRHGKKVERKKISGATCNREVSCLIAALNLARDQGLCEDAPSIKKERETPRERILTDAEFRALLAASPAWLRRVLVAARETGFDRGVLLDLTWDCVLPGLVIVKGGRAKTGARQRVGISPDLAEVLDELRSEYQRTPHIERKVFTTKGRPIPHTTLRHAVEKAVRDAGIEDFQFRDFRHCARTRWAAMGLPFEVAEIGLGHKLRGIAGRYVNLSDEQIRAAFQEMFTKIAATSQEKTKAG